MVVLSDPYSVETSFVVEVYTDCVLNNEEHYYDRVAYSPDLSSQNFYWEIPKTCFSEDNDNEIFFINSVFDSE